jgi:hypothetical protein
MESSDSGLSVLVIHPSDNCGVAIRGVVSADPEKCVPQGHKMATKAISEGDPVVRYGYTIGLAVRDIAIGDWIHLHNCRSQYDERGNSLNPQSGIAEDTPYE